MKKLFVLGLIAGAVGGAHAVELFSNGAVVDGAGLSILQSPSTTLGLASNASFAVAEDFTVGGGATWNVQSLDFFAYQTNSTSFTYTSVAWSLISGSNVNTGLIVASGTTSVTNGGLVGYRVTSTTLTSTARPIYRISADIPDLTLASGSYWLTWSLAGSGTLSGPFVPATLGSVGIGNALSGPVAGGAFAVPIDTTSGTPIIIGLPFSIQGAVVAVPEPATYAMMLVGVLGLAGVARRRAGKA